MPAIKNILAVRNDRLGEFLLNIPAFRALKETFPGARLVLAADPYLEELAKKIEGVDEVILWENRKHRLPEVIRFSGALKRHNFDLCVIFNPAQDSHLACFLAGIPLRVGYGRKWGFLLNRKARDLKHLGLKHEVEYNLELAALAGARTLNPEVSLDVGEIFTDPNTIAIHPWTSDPVKQWPLEHFKELAQRIINETGRNVVVVGGPENTAKSREYFSGLGVKALDLTGKTSLMELARTVKKAALLISGDSGPVHLAVAVGTPVVALFRSDLLGKTAKRWGPWSRNSAVIEKESLADIAVHEVLDKVKEMIR